MLDHELSAMDMHLAVGLMGCIAGLQQTSDSGRATFAALRDTTKLLPEKLIGLLDELRFGGYLEYAENETGNPYGYLSLTAEGNELLEGAGQDVSLFMANTPLHYKVSAPERSTRHGGKRASEPSTAP